MTTADSIRDLLDQLAALAERERAADQAIAEREARIDAALAQVRLP